MSDADAIAGFFRRHRATAVGPTPPRPELPPPDDEAAAKYDFTVERERPDEWAPVLLGEADSAAPGEYPERFIDGSHLGQPVLCVRSPQGYPVAVVVAEVGAVALRLAGRQFTREFRAVERVLGMVADPFPWEEFEAFAGAMANHPLLRLRVLPAKKPDEKKYSPFDRNKTEHHGDWVKMGIDDPKPFDKPGFFAPQARGLTTPVLTGGRNIGVVPYSWSLGDII